LVGNTLLTYMESLGKQLTARWQNHNATTS